MAEESSDTVFIYGAMAGGGEITASLVVFMLPLFSLFLNSKLYVINKKLKYLVLLDMCDYITSKIRSGAKWLEK